MKSTDRMALAVAVSMALAAATMFELTTDRAFLVVAVPLIALVQAISAVSRRFGITGWLIHLWQVLVLAGIGLGLGLGANPETGNWLSQLWRLYLEGLLHIQTQSAPMTPSPGVRWLLLLLIGLVTIIADVLVLTLATPAWMLAPLLTLYLIPALALQEPVRWRTFLLIGLAYLLVLAADTLSGLASWTRNLASDNAVRSHSQSGVWRMAGVVGVPALAASLLLGSTLPALGSFDVNAKRPRGSGPIQLQDPTIELNRNLAQQSERVVATYTSDSPNGEYLRLTALPVMDRSGWKLTNMNLQDGTDLGIPVGVNVTSTRFTTTITTREFGSQYLPVPYAPSVVNVAGQWGFDPRSLTVVSTAANGTDATRNLSYDVTSVRTDPVPAQFNRAQPGTPVDSAITDVLPSDVPPEISRLTSEVTKDAATPVLKAAAIQDYLRDPRQFQYSTTAPPGDGYEVMVNFLTTTKQGYCIHFASAMAIMARVEGIPSRVAVGFLPGTQTGAKTWQVQGKNMHAWPELYFSGFGWVRYEPTSALGEAPAWSEVSDDTAPSVTPSSTASASVDPTSSATSDPSASPSASDDPSVTGEGQGAFPWRQVLSGLGVLALALLVISGPMVARSVLRYRRLHPDWDDPHGATAGLWAELRDTVIDTGQPWPEGSPRDRSAVVGSDLTPEGREALGRLALMVERSRYSRHLGAAPTAVEDTRQVTRELRDALPSGDRVHAFVVPTSLWYGFLRWVRRG